MTMDINTVNEEFSAAGLDMAVVYLPDHSAGARLTYNCNIATKWSYR